MEEEEAVVDIEEEIIMVVDLEEDMVEIIMGEMEVEEEDIKEMIHLQKVLTIIGQTIMNPKGFIYYICDFTSIYVFTFEKFKIKDVM